jgi:hypothetical protein
MFRWQAASPVYKNFSWELYYQLLMDSDSEFTNPQVFSDLYDTTYAVNSLIPGQKYFWKVLARNITGDSLWSSEKFGFLMSPNATEIICHQNIYSQQIHLFSNYPNPFNQKTAISYNLSDDKPSYDVILRIYNILGEVVSTLVNERQSWGLHRVYWNGQNLNGQTVPSGIYYYVLNIDNVSLSGKMIVLK